MHDQHDDTASGNDNGRKWKNHPFGATRALLVAFLASFALHTTAASSVWAFAYLSCVDPDQCREDETRKYAGSVAASSAMANTVGLLSLGYLKQGVQWNVRLSLTIWLLCRAVGVLGVFCGGQTLQGLASDNLFHFMLNSIYVHVSPASTSALIGASLACYMSGMAIAPLIAGWLPSLYWTFLVAIGIFMVTILYVLLMIPPIPKEDKPAAEIISLRSSTSRKFISVSALLSPIRFFWTYPTTILFGLSLFLYNTVQGYFINLIFIFTSVEFKFTPSDNGIFLSVIAITAAAYLICSSFLVPKLLTWVYRTTGHHRTVQVNSLRLFDLGAAILSIMSQTGAVILLTQSRHVYLAASLTAIGLATPSFIKSFVVAQSENKSEAVAALAIMEAAGSLLSPLILGPWQATHPGASAFYIIIGILFGSVGCLVLGGCAEKRGARDRGLES
ncbi:hypothetical protein N7491_007865 [Penicillium cf. griseofulvum]|uniref:Uncharacterized protein n=1 Tax=Penicillium cf. griseofulvum TaxID=2972120 RepID=A0A9W9J5M3_9EURO|nr:hypothetical protein N7472_009106 [Penicillium cf. griseofulvum]KAJ5427423.1 hypothetical protein N7491_007865 [Penicillium cf. griseofulvum]KAJ5431623.1 hypothetical protein N7445_008121 [Penicillium cf. griseofulvum]